MGLTISSAIWQSYINAIINCLQNRKYCEAIIDNLLLFTPMKSAHFHKLEDLPEALCKIGLKISPKKCQLFKSDLQYMGNTIFIRNKRVCVRLLRSQIEANQKLEPPTTIKGYRNNLIEPLILLILCLSNFSIYRTNKYLCCCQQHKYLFVLYIEKLLKQGCRSFVGLVNLLVFSAWSFRNF